MTLPLKALALFVGVVLFGALLGGCAIVPRNLNDARTNKELAWEAYVEASDQFDYVAKREPWRRDRRS